MFQTDRRVHFGNLLHFEHVIQPIFKRFQETVIHQIGIFIADGHIPLAAQAGFLAHLDGHVLPVHREIDFTNRGFQGVFVPVFHVFNGLAGVNLTQCREHGIHISGIQGELGVLFVNPAVLFLHQRHFLTVMPGERRYLLRVQGEDGGVYRLLLFFGVELGCGIRRPQQDNQHTQQHNQFLSAFHLRFLRNQIRMPTVR